MTHFNRRENIKEFSSSENVRQTASLSNIFTVSWFEQTSSLFYINHSFSFIVKYSFVCLLVCLSSAIVLAQTSQTDGSTPAGLQRGGPAGSYQLSGFDNVNLYNGNLSFNLPLMSIGGRGAASSGLTLSINSKRWHVEDYSNEYYESFVPDPNWRTSLDVG